MSNTDLTKHIVLYADDDPDDLFLVREAFDRFADNVELVTANDGAEAINYLQNLTPGDPTPCLIILDVNMPRLNGKEALKVIRSHERYEQVPVVLFTTSSFPLDVQFAKNYSAGFITKPLNFKHVELIASEFMDYCSEEIRKNIRRKMA